MSFSRRKSKQEGRIVSVLSDGLGSGVKASVLATMTATMALKFAASAMDIRTSAEIIMDTLPICSVRKISYSTFTVVDMASTGETRIIEHGNPPFLLIRPNGELNIEKTEVRPKRWQDRVISFSSFDVQREDRIIFFSDGITQAGMGEYRTPLGWGLENVDKFVREKIARYPVYLGPRVVAPSGRKSGRSRRPQRERRHYLRRGLLPQPAPVAGDDRRPFNRAHDHDLANDGRAHPGRKVICGGTTANIISRLLNRAIQIDMRQQLDPKVPPSARMEGFDLVTEGTLTLGEVLRLLEEGFAPEDMRSNRGGAACDHAARQRYCEVRRRHQNQ